MTPLPDDVARERIRDDLDHTLVVEAAAGTGKTSELVRRIVNVLADGRTTVDRLVAVTFTEKAAGELKLRLRAGLEAARSASDVAAGFSRPDADRGGTPDSPRARGPEPRAPARVRHIEHALAHLEEAHVSTIHGFCAELLRERPVEARVDPRFEVLTEAEAERFFARTFDGWLEAQLEHPPEGVRRSLRRIPRASRFAEDEDGDGPTERLRKAGRELCDWRDFTAPWTREPFDREALIDEVIGHVHDFAGLTEGAANKRRDGLYLDTWRARRLSQDVRRAERVRHRDHDGLEALLVDLASDRDFTTKIRKGYGAQYAPGVARADVQKAHADLVEILRGFKQVVDSDLAARLQGELRGVIDRYRARKDEDGRLDFVDLLVRARDLVRDHDRARADFQRRFTHLFVDEFQDTDPLQAEILLLLAAADPAERDWRRVAPVPGKLFIVGDPKQSIYRFRRADVGVYREVRDQLVARGAALERLTTSFRSAPSLQALVNAAFAPVMAGEGDSLQADYVPLAPFRADPEGQPTTVVLPVPRPYGVRRLSAARVDASLPDAVGAFVAWLIERSGWTVTERRPEYGGARSRAGSGLARTDGADRVPIAARHVCILFRRFDSYGGDVTRAYVDALEARGVPHLLVGGKTFHAREEVETMRAALAAIEWPDDELSVFAALRGSLFAVPDEWLLAYRERFGRLHPYRRPEEAGGRGPAAGGAGPPASVFHPILSALALLRDLHARRNDVPVTGTIGRLLAETRAHAGFVLRPSGEQALANVLQIAELARQYEGSGGISFRGFVDMLQEEAESGQAGEAPILEEGSDGVRLMTVHKAKGLEFPVVILADITAKIARTTAGRHIDAERGLCALRLAGWAPLDLLRHEDLEVRRDRAEGVRLAYVAATRARDLLVVPAVGDEPYPSDGWVAPLTGAIYPAPDARRDAGPAPGCPRFGKDTVLERPDGEPFTSRTVAPGLHRLAPPTPGAQRQSPTARAAPAPGPGPRVPGPVTPYSLVWWDPRALDLDREGRYGLRQEELVGKDAPANVVAKDLETYLAWKDARAAAIAAGRVPSLRVRTITDFAQDPSSDVEAGLSRPDDHGGVTPGTPGDRSPEPGAKVSVIDLPRDAHRPAGPRFGALVHAVLALVALDAVADGVREMADVQGRVLGATPDEVEAAAGVVSAVLGHAILARARAAGAVRRETPLTAVTGDGTLLEGTVDLAFEEDGRWTVVDFKTDRELDEALDVYERQVRLYARIVSDATGQPAEAVIMRI